jgi:hypothetical protein
VGVVVKAVVVGDVLVVVLVVKDVDSLEEESVERVADGFSLASEDWALSVVEDPVDRVLLVRVGVGVVDGDALEVVPSRKKGRMSNFVHGLVTDRDHTSCVTW